MPESLSWSDTFNRMVVPDTICYVLPDDVRHRDAPSKIVIDGFCTLNMKRTRISVHNNQPLRMVVNSDALRTPMYARRTPQPPPPTVRPGVPLDPMGSIEPQSQPSKMPTLTYTTTDLLLFGAYILLACVGPGLLAPYGLGKLALVTGIAGAAIVFFLVPWERERMARQPDTPNTEP